MHKACPSTTWFMGTPRGLTLPVAINRFATAPRFRVESMTDPWQLYSQVHLCLPLGQCTQWRYLYFKKLAEPPLGRGIHTPRHLANTLRALWNPEVQCRIHKGSPIIPIQSWINPIPRIDTHFFNIHSNILIFPINTWVLLKISFL